jgi:hypothetical protein
MDAREFTLTIQGDLSPEREEAMHRALEELAGKFGVHIRLEATRRAAWPGDTWRDGPPGEEEPHIPASNNQLASGPPPGLDDD